MEVILLKLCIFLIIWQIWCLDTIIIKHLDPSYYQERKMRLGILWYFAKMMDWSFIILIGYLINKINIDFLFN